MHIFDVSIYCVFLYIKFQPEFDHGNFCCLRDETLKVEFVRLSSKLDILATLGAHKCYFEMSSSALCYTGAFRSIFNEGPHLFFIKHENHFIVSLLL